jgi:hypothetical protein
LLDLVQDAQQCGAGLDEAVEWQGTRKNSDPSVSFYFSGAPAFAFGNGSEAAATALDIRVPKQSCEDVIASAQAGGNYNVPYTSFSGFAFGENQS